MPENWSGWARASVSESADCFLTMDQPFNYFQLFLFATAIAAIPMLAVTMTSYTKIVVVLNIVRNALGVQQTPPNMALNGLAVIMTLYIMAPIFSDCYDRVKAQNNQFQTIADYELLVTDGGQPIKSFLTRHTTDRHRQFFILSAGRIWGERDYTPPKQTDFMVLIPAFMVGELTRAFEIGFLLYLPFIAVDLVVTNILMALGLSMVSPVVLSVPFKLFLFVIVDGWARLVNGLVLSYAVPTG